MYKKTQLASLDIGFGRCQGVDGLGNFVSHRSCVVRVNDAELANYSDSTGHYMVGDDAVSFSDEQRSSTDTQYFESDVFRVLYLYTLKRLQDIQARKLGRVVANDWVVIIGLPVEFYETLKDKHKAWLVGAFKKSFANKPPFTVNKIQIVEQPRGTVWSPKVCDVEGKEVRLYTKDKVGVVDIGDGTTDIVEAYKGRILKSDRTIGLNKGCSNIHEFTLNAIRSKYTLDAATNVHHVDKAFRGDGKFDAGTEVIDLHSTKGFKDAVKIYLKELSEKLKGQWEGYNTLEFVCFTGGGTQLIPREMFKTLSVPERKIVFGDSDTNVYGYMEFLTKGLAAKNLLGE